MNRPLPPSLSSVSRSFKPSTGTIQVGYREISGTLLSSGDRVHLHAWALVYPLCVVADSFYELFVRLFAEVNSNGMVALPVAGISGQKFANMSERVDLLGERATIWVSSTIPHDGKRGAVLAAVSDNLVHLLSLEPYAATRDERAVYLLEDIVQSAAGRMAELKLSPTADTMGRLPVLQDIGDLLANTRVDASWYKVADI